MARLAEWAGGEPPLSKRPDTNHLTDIANRVANDQLQAIYESKDRLTQEIGDWNKRKQRIAERDPRWRQLQGLLDHAADLPPAAEVRAEVQAIEANRRLLDDPDHVPGLVDKLTQALRKALNAAHTTCSAAHTRGMTDLEASQSWQKCSPEQRYEILSQHGLRLMPTIAVGNTEEILNTLRQVKVSELAAIHDALPTRFSNALAAAVKLLEPKAQSVSLPSGTIKNDDDLKSWLTTAEEKIREKLKDGPVIV